MRLNLRLVRTSQFLQQFKLNVRYKPSKKYIIPDKLNWLASSNIGTIEPSYLELDALSVYNTTLIEIHPNLVSRILAGYNLDLWWARLYQQIQSNRNLSANPAVLPFVLVVPPAIDADPYLGSQPEHCEPFDVSKDFTALKKHPKLEAPAAEKTKLL